LLKRLLDRLLATRARRDREVRFSDSWRAADDELHAIERAIFRAPLDPPREDAAGSMRPFPGQAEREARARVTDDFAEERAG
jgi:hypothetical protein